MTKRESCASPGTAARAGVAPATCVAAYSGRVRDARELDDGVVRGPVFGARLLEQFGSLFDAASAARTTAGAHGELGQPATAGPGRLADVAVGHAIAAAHVHGPGMPSSGERRHCDCE